VSNRKLSPIKIPENLLSPTTGIFVSGVICLVIVGDGLGLGVEVGECVGE
jgi:hypothetical protein